MQAKEQRTVPSESEMKDSQSLASTNANVVTNGSRGKQSLANDSEIFYRKLSELLDSCGLSLIFDVREALLDLYLFYSEVIRRGGYRQVSRDRKWDEVVAALNLEGGNADQLPAQLEKLYAFLLYQFEQLYHYKGPAKQSAAKSTLGLTHTKRGLKRKRNAWANEAGAGSGEQKLLLLEPPPSKDKQMKKSRGASAYQIFIKQECARLRTCNQAMGVSNSKVFPKANEAWRKMSDIDKQPYEEESKKDKERFMKEKKSHSAQKSKQNTMEEKRPGLDGDYLVTLQPDAGNPLLVDEATGALALQMAEQAPKHPLLLVDWDACF